MPEIQRHPATVAILRHFQTSHLPFELAAVSNECRILAETMAVRLDGPELTAGLRKLLEAKDCFVRAAVEQLRAENEES
jgi:hypothetical protein